MKNAFGGLLNHHRHYTHSWIHETLVDLLAIQKEIHAGVFAVMDGTMAGNGTGPRVMKPETKNVILASGDQVAIDAVAAKMMGFDPLEIGYIRMESKARLRRPQGHRVSATRTWRRRTGISKVGVNLPAPRLALVVRPHQVLQRLLFHTRSSTRCRSYPRPIDYFRWPLFERRFFERWRRNNPWGRLFAEYQEGAQ